MAHSRPIIAFSLAFTLLFAHAVNSFGQDRIQRIAFGSCSRQDIAAQLWDDVLINRPDLWIWLGDNIYGDTEDMEVMREKYMTQKSHAGYQQLIRTTPVYGVWDDHDYGVNDGGKEYPMKAESKELMMEFLDITAENEVRHREGTYQAYMLGNDEERICLILLDTRYFRDELMHDASGRSRYLPNPDGDILGETQWEWLEEQLKNNDAPLTLIASSIQVIPEEHPYEKWANFPAARSRLMNLISQYGTGRTVILSGDRHIAEISHWKNGDGGPDIYEFTSSGLTHTWSSERAEANRHRIGELYIRKNFGLIHIDWNSSPPSLILEVRGEGNVLYGQQEIE